MIDLDKKISVKRACEECVVCEERHNEAAPMIAVSFRVQVVLASVEKTVYLHTRCASVLVSALQDRITEASKAR